MWCLITENHCFLQSKMTKRSDRGKKILTIVAENSSFCEQFPTLSDFRSLKNFEKLGFKEELFSLIWSFRNVQCRDAHFPTGNRETGNKGPGNFPREMGDREKSGNREKNCSNWEPKTSKMLSNFAYYRIGNNVIIQNWSYQMFH